VAVWLICDVGKAVGVTQTMV